MRDRGPSCAAQAEVGGHPGDDGQRREEDGHDERSQVTGMVTSRRPIAAGYAEGMPARR